MTDPLGQTQVINYLIGLSLKGYSFDILSFEKTKRYKLYKDQIGKLLLESNIDWYPQVFHTSPPILSKFYDKSKAFFEASRLHKKNKYDLIHCRSYIASEIGLKLKRKTGVKFIFDMRGFWADEKADGGSWDRNNWFWNKVYLSYKNKEKDFIVESDYIISLTEAAKNEMESWTFYNATVPIKVIPCCADSNHFALVNKSDKIEAKKMLNIDPSNFVLSYLGSLGSWYMLDEMLDFYKCLIKKSSNAVFLVITNSNLDSITDQIRRRGLLDDNIIVLNLPYSEVPKYMAASDLSLSFVKPVYSKMSSSPVKNGEILSMGIPLVMSNIGDAAKMELLEACWLLNEFTHESYSILIDKIFNSATKDPVQIREWAISHFSLESGVKSYSEVYHNCI